MIACDNPDCSIESQVCGTCGCTKWKVALNALNVLFIKAIWLFRNALFQCENHILAKFNNPQQVLLRFIKRKLLPYDY